MFGCLNGNVIHRHSEIIIVPEPQRLLEVICGKQKSFSHLTLGAGD